jgi:co-chaperonin GroES (HSP10)
MIRAIGDKIVVEELKRTQSKGGIIFPENAGEPQAYGKVLSIGEDVENIKVGDVIVCHPQGGQASLIGKTLLRILMYKEVYGILEDPDTIDSLAEMEIAGSTEGQPTVKEKSNIIHPVS